MLGLAWTVGVLVCLLALDRSLLWMEGRGWIYYRRSRLARGAATYHLLEMSAVFDPGFKEVIEAKLRQEEDEAEAGDPLGAGRSNHPETYRADPVAPGSRD